MGVSIGRLGVVMVILFVTACGGATSAPSTSLIFDSRPSTSVTTLDPSPSGTPESGTPVTLQDEPTPVSTTTTAPPPPTAETMPDGWSLAARSDAPLEVFADPEAVDPLMTLTAETDLGSPRVVRVLSGPTDGWAEVSVPVRPNGTTGWIKAEAVTLFEVDRSVLVDIGDHRLTVLGPDGVLFETDVAVGGVGSPTPPGSYFVTDSVEVLDPRGPWGPHAFGLSAFSDTITEFNGGDGIIGIHGTNRPSSIGTNASLGCVRVNNDAVLELTQWMSAGVPVEIVR